MGGVEFGFKLHKSGCGEAGKLGLRFSSRLKGILGVLRSELVVLVP